MTCRGFQYEVGKEYEMEGNIECCERGFHACENPLDVLNYYNDIDNKYCEVEQSGSIDRESGDSKVASSRIKIKAEIGFAGLFKAGIEWLKEITDPSKIQETSKPNDEGGDSDQIGSSGDYAKIGSSGHSAKIGSSGDYAKIGSSGDYAKIGSSGDSAQIGSSGDYAKIDSTGNDSVICCAGHGCRAKAKVGSWITLAEWARIDGKWKPVCVKTEYVDGERIKADTWYELKDGQFKEAEV